MLLALSINITVEYSPKKLPFGARCRTNKSLVRSFSMSCRWISIFPSESNNKNRWQKITFQQVGSPAHFSKAVRSWLNSKVPDRWIGRDEQISWAPRSPDLTQLNFFLWGHIKANVYKTKVQDIDDLKTRITQEIKTIKTETLHDIVSEISKRMNFVLQPKVILFNNIYEPFSYK